MLGMLLPPPPTSLPFLGGDCRCFRFIFINHKIGHAAGVMDVDDDASGLMRFWMRFILSGDGGFLQDEDWVFAFPPPFQLTN